MKEYLRRKVQPLKQRGKKKPLSEEIRSMYKLLSATMLILGVASVASFLYVNSLKPAKGYQLKQLQLNFENLQAEKRDLERQIIEAQSFSNLEGSDTIYEMNVAETGEFSYLEDSAYAHNSGD